MNDALGYVYSIFDKFINFIFNNMLLDSGVSVGWVIVSIFIFSFVIRNILVVPSVGSNTHSKEERKDS